MKKLTLIGGLLALVANLAQATVYSYNYTGGYQVPDGSVTGISDTKTISLAADFGPNYRLGETTLIRDVNVRLDIAGGYNGDLYVYLVHSSGFAVLLNRSGRTSGDAFGYGDTGFNITLDGQGPQTPHAVTDDVHNYSVVGNNPSFSGGRLTGTWLKDGRNVDPATVLDADARTALLNSFNGTDADGSWTLFLADMSGGGVATVQGWGLDITVVPEPTTWALIIFAVIAAVAGYVRWQQRLRLQPCRRVVQKES